MINHDDNRLGVGWHCDVSRRLIETHIAKPLKLNIDGAYVTDANSGLLAVIAASPEAFKAHETIEQGLDSFSRPINWRSKIATVCCWKRAVVKPSTLCSLVNVKVTVR